MPSYSPTAWLVRVHHCSSREDAEDHNFFEMETYLAGLHEKPYIQMTMHAEKNMDDVQLLAKYKRPVTPRIYCGQAYLRREYMNTGSWTGPSRAAARISPKSAVSGKQPSPEGVETRAARRKRLEVLAQEQPMPVRIEEKQSKHGIASPARICKPLETVDNPFKKSWEYYTIVRFGCYLFVTIVVKTYREELRINSARVRVYQITEQRTVRAHPLIDKDYKELPVLADETHVHVSVHVEDLPPSLCSEIFLRGYAHLSDVDNQIYHVTWTRRGPQNETETDVYISCELDVESEQNIWHCITQYMEGSFE